MSIELDGIGHNDLDWLLAATIRQALLPNLFILRCSSRNEARPPGVPFFGRHDTNRADTRMQSASA